MGDGVLAYFGYPRADEHDAERAVRAGLELVEAVAALDTPADAPVQVRVGIATGLVVVGDLIGEGAAQEQSVVGETPNLAARLQALAEPRTVVIGPSTRRLTAGLFDYEDLGTVKIKGFAAPVTASRVRHARHRWHWPVAWIVFVVKTTGATETFGMEQKSWFFQIMAALAAEDEDVAAERIGADDLLCLCRQAVEAGAQIKRETPSFPAAGQSSGPPQGRQDPPQRLLVDATIDAHPNPVRQIDLDHPDTLGQGQTGTPRAYRTRRHWHCRALTRCIGDDTELNKFGRPHRRGSRRQRCGLPCRSPIVQQACRNPVPASNHRNLAALGFYLG
jgi:hypothetical protein